MEVKKVVKYYSPTQRGKPFKGLQFSLDKIAFRIGLMPYPWIYGPSFRFIHSMIFYFGNPKLGWQIRFLWLTFGWTTDEKYIGA